MGLRRDAPQNGLIKPACSLPPLPPHPERRLTELGPEEVTSVAKPGSSWLGRACFCPPSPRTLGGEAMLPVWRHVGAGHFQDTALTLRPDDRHCQS